MKTQLFIILLAICMQAHAGDNDTLTISKPTKVTIITGDSLQRIIVKGREGDPNYTYRNTIELVDSNYVSNVSINKDRWDLSVGVGKKRDDGCYSYNLSLNLGVGTPIFADKQPGVHLNEFRSYEAFVQLNLNGFLNRRQTDWFTLGVGLIWNHYYSSNGFRFIKDDNGDTQLVSVGDGIDLKSSHVKTFGYNATLLYNHMFARKWGIGAGIFTQKNFSSRVKAKYKMDGKSNKESAKHANVNKTMFGWMGLVYTPVVDVYVKYSPEWVLAGDGAKFKAITLGVYY